MVKLSTQQIDFFSTFGYIVLPGLMADSINWITSEFEAVFTDQGIVHDGTERSAVTPFIDRRAKLCTLLDDPRIVGLAASLLGDDFHYFNSDGNYYTGDTRWHFDWFSPAGRYIKIALYLDPVKRDSGALCVIPGSHRMLEDKDRWGALDAVRSQELWGIEMSEVPSIALESTPGDIVAFDMNLMHASFGGSKSRRMIAIGMGQHVETPEEVENLKSLISVHARLWIDHMHSEIMRGTASAERMRHLQQVIHNEGHLAGLAAKARLEMPEKARG